MHVSKSIVRRIAALVGAACLSGLPALAQRESPFMEEFRKLMPGGDVEEMARLVKQHELAAELAVIEICEEIGMGSSDQLEDEIDALNKAWKKAYDSGFVDIQYRYFSLDLSPAYKKSRRELIGIYLPKYNEFTGARERKDAAKLAALGPDFLDYGDQFITLGDQYRASRCYGLYAECFDERSQGAKPDLHRACEGYKKMLEAQEKIDLKNKTYAEAKLRFQALEAEGYGDPSKGPEARAAEKAATDASYAATPLDATFQLVPDLEAVVRPSFFADVNYQMWPTIVLGAVDSKATIPTMDKSPAVLRLSAAKAAIDVDGNGSGDVELPLTGKISPVEITLGEGDLARRWAFLVTVGQQQDNYQGWRMNLGADENQMQIFIAAAGSVVGTVNGIRVQVIDDNLDGIYGGKPTEHGYTGLRDGSFQKEMDSVVIGEEAKFAVPWSELQKFGDQWYRLGRPEGSEDLAATKADVKSGTLALDLKGVNADWLVVRGTGTLENCYFDLVQGGAKKVEVPEGNYELFCGQVSTGKRTQMLKALVLAAPETKTWRVIAGETLKVELGAPFGFDFKFTQDEETISVEGPSVVVTGRGGETYQRFWNCVPMPEVNVRKAGATKGKKEEKLIPVGSQEELIDAGNDYRFAWFPLNKQFPKPKKGEPVELQLVEKKNKLFGKVESDWQAD